jgi:rSAM/selenodomain-associated transferase 2
VPTLNEEQRIDTQLRHLYGLPGIAEVIVADGGSTDRTRDVVKASPAQLVDAPRGRAAQMNAGARAASGSVLLFLHADVLLPDNAAEWVERILADNAVAAGAFRTWTVEDAPGRLGPLLHLADVRSRYTSLPYGDQALFMRAATFEAVGGFPEQELMEDLEFALRLRRLGKIRTAKASVRVSGRRFVARPIFYTLLVNVFPLLYRAGVPPHVLARYYADIR